MRSRRKYHSAVTRNWLFDCQGIGALFLPFTYQSNEALKNRQILNGWTEKCIMDCMESMDIKGKAENEKSRFHGLFEQK
jgi:hypothetical protein